MRESISIKLLVVDELYPLGHPRLALPLIQLNILPGWIQKLLQIVDVRQDLFATIVHKVCRNEANLDTWTSPLLSSSHTSNTFFRLATISGLRSRLLLSSSVAAMSSIYFV